MFDCFHRGESGLERSPSKRRNWNIHDAPSTSVGKAAGSKPNEREFPTAAQMAFAIHPSLIIDIYHHCCILDYGMAFFETQSKTVVMKYYQVHSNSWDHNKARTGMIT